MQFSDRVSEAQRFAKMELKDFEEKKRAGTVPKLFWPILTYLKLILTDLTFIS